jgi:hypothetical protein
VGCIYILLKKVFLLVNKFSILYGILGFNIIFTRAYQPEHILSMYDIINANVLEGGFYFERKATFVTRSENLSKEDFINLDLQTSYILLTKRLKQSESCRDGNLCCKQSSVNIGPRKRNFSPAPKTSKRINEISRDALNSL